MSSTFRKRRLFPRSLAECAGAVTEPAFRAHGFAETRLLKAWSSVVGAELAEACTPVALRVRKGRDGSTEQVLVVRAPSAAATMLAYMTPQIVERIAVYFGYRAVHALRVEHGAASAPKAPARMAVRSGGNASGVPAAPLGAPVADEALAGALQRLAEAMHNPLIHK